MVSTDDCPSFLRCLSDRMDDDGDEEMVVEGDIFERLGSGFGTSILSASDFDSKNGLFGLC